MTAQGFGGIWLSLEQKVSQSFSELSFAGCRGQRRPHPGVSRARVGDAGVPRHLTRRHFASRAHPANRGLLPPR